MEGQKRPINQQTQMGLGSTLFCGGFSGCCLCVGMLIAIEADFNSLSGSYFFAFVLSIGLIIAASIILCCNRTEEFCLKTVFVGCVISIAVLQLVAICLGYGSVDGSADHACSGDMKLCFSSNATCGCEGKDWCDDGKAVRCYASGPSHQSSCGNMHTHRGDDVSASTAEWRGFRTKDDCKAHKYGG